MPAAKVASKTPRRDTFDLAGVNFDACGGKNLSGRIAAALMDKIREDGIAPGVRLPTEHVMAERFGVSRTVIREAMVSLKAEGLIETRQGSGAYVRRPGAKSAFAIDPLAPAPQQHLIMLIEMRRAIESEIASLAAQRRTPAQIDDLRQRLNDLTNAAAARRNGVHEDIEFHLAIARATGNLYWVKLVEMFAPQLHTAITVTRADEDRRQDLALVTQTEHQRIFEAIVAQDSVAARAAATEHMDGAIMRIKAVDPKFWSHDGQEQARKVMESL